VRSAIIFCLSRSTVHCSRFLKQAGTGGPVRNRLADFGNNLFATVCSVVVFFALGLRRLALYIVAQFALAGSARTILGTGL
jgi:hypothetical protein